MGSTYLDLTNRVLRRLNEVTIDSTEFATVRGIQAAAKDAIIDTIREINSQKFEWPFNSETYSQTLTVGQEEYSWPSGFKIVDWESFYIENDGTLSTTTVKLSPINKKEWYYMAMPSDNDSGADGISVPYFVFETNSGGFGVTPSPDKAYVLKYKYWSVPTDLSAYSDTTNIPTEFDYVIMYGALSHMFIFLDNDERAAKFERNFTKGLADMSYILIPKDKYMTDTRIAHNAQQNTIT